MSYCDRCDDIALSGDTGCYCGSCMRREKAKAASDATVVGEYIGAERVLDAIGNPAKCRDCEADVWFVQKWGGPGARGGKGRWWIFGADGRRHECGEG